MNYAWVEKKKKITRPYSLPRLADGECELWQKACILHSAQWERGEPCWQRGSATCLPLLLPLMEMVVLLPPMEVVELESEGRGRGDTDLDRNGALWSYF